MTSKLKFKLTTECGYHWNYGFRNSYWKNWYKPRLLTGGWENGVRVKTPSRGVAFGPIMFFWRWS